MKNKVQLITYVDRFTGSSFTKLQQLLNQQFKQLFSGIHLLPFYYPIDGSDAGFDPIDHCQVDQRLGDWQNVHRLGEQFDLMADLIVNHVSARSVEFKDVLAHGKNSPYWDLFITEDKIFPNGITKSQQEKIYRPRPGSCFSKYTLADGSEVEFWTTFTRNQLDIDVNSTAGKRYLSNILTKFAQNNVKIIRLDAAGYAIKKAGTCCFMLPETYQFIEQLTQQANALGMETLVEIHSHYKTQIAIAKRVGRVYDFALPPLILHTIFTKNAQALLDWLSISPKSCITVLDTHDGIGIIDVGAVEGKTGLLTATEIDDLVNQIHHNSDDQSLKATGAAASNVDLYQINCTYYDALGKNDFHYLLARAIQFFAPGTPQVYYAGLLAETNDMTLLSQTNVGRDINRPYLDEERINQAVQKGVVKALIALIKLRNNCHAFVGEFTIQGKQTHFIMTWQYQDETASLTVDLKSNSAVMVFKTANSSSTINLADLLMTK
jgi:sucrose phosphorylase